MEIGLIFMVPLLPGVVYVLACLSNLRRGQLSPRGELETLLERKHFVGFAHLARRVREKKYRYYDHLNQATVSIDELESSDSPSV